MSIQEWLNPNHQRQIQALSPVNENSESVVINVEDHSSASSDVNESPNSEHQHQSFGENFSNNARDAANGGNQNNNDAETNPSQSTALNAEARATQKSLEHYLPFLTILLTKCKIKSHNLYYFIK